MLQKSIVPIHLIWNLVLYRHRLDSIHNYTYKLIVYLVKTKTDQWTLSLNYGLLYTYLNELKQSDKHNRSVVCNKHILNGFKRIGEAKLNLIDDFAKNNNSILSFISYILFFLSTLGLLYY